MDRRKLSALFCLQIQHACIIAAMLMAGCAAPRSAIVNSTASPPLSKVNDAATDQSVIKLAATDESLQNTTESLPAPRQVDQGEDSITAETLDPQPGQSVSLPDAIALAFQRQPRLRVFLEGIQQASARSDIAFAPFLPMVST